MSYELWLWRTLENWRSNMLFVLDKWEIGAVKVNCNHRFVWAYVQEACWGFPYSPLLQSICSANYQQCYSWIRYFCIREHLQIGCVAGYQTLLLQLIRNLLNTAALKACQKAISPSHYTQKLQKRAFSLAKLKRQHINENYYTMNITYYCRDYYKACILIFFYFLTALKKTQKT